MTLPKRILVVDDESQIHRFLKPSLTVSGFDVVTALNGQQALRSFTADHIDIVLLDLGLPDMDGKDVLAKIRQQSDVPIVILSARDRESEKIAALDLGADDYVNKPFAIGELLARLRSALRRRSMPISDTPTELQVGDITINIPDHKVTRSGHEVHLTPKEFELITLLFRHADRVITHRQILSEVWGPAHGADTQYLRVFIGQLRQKLEKNPADPTIIQTEPGIGYRAARPEP